jgi:hypothetical protein
MDTKPTPAVTMTGEQFTQLLDAIKASSTGDGSAAEAMMAMVQAQQRTVRQSNAYTPGISPFSYPEGEEARPKPKLDRDTWWLGTRAEESQLTPDEILAFNSVTTSKVWRGDPKFGAEVTPKRRFIMLPHQSIDDRMGLPQNVPLAIRELLNGEDAIDPIKMEQEIRALKQQVSSLATRVNQSPAVADAAKPVEAEF